MDSAIAENVAAKNGVSLIMKNWERKLREQQKLTLTKRLVYATAGFLSSGLLCPFLIFGLFCLNGRHHQIVPLWFPPAAGAAFVVLFTLLGFFAGEKVIDMLSRIWKNLFGV